MSASQKVITLTDKQMDCVIEHYGKLSVSEIAYKIGETKSKVYCNYRVYKKNINKVDEALFNLSENKNWIV